MNLKNSLKLPYYFIKNLQYNRQTKKVFKSILKPGSNCIDIGAHKGRILDLMLELSPKGTHWAFEPLPELFEFLIKKYKGKNVFISSSALSDSEGETTFNYVKNSPGYSGFRKREYHIPFPEIKEMIVAKTKLDTIIPADTPIDLIKLDVEGAELEVLRGAEQTISRCKPYIIFEHGIGAAPFYNTKPEDVYDLLISYGLKISTMKNWLKEKPALNRKSFSKQFDKEINYYFIAHAGHSFSTD